MKQLSVIFLLLGLPIIVCAQGVTGTWSTASSTGFTARTDFATAAVNGKIYVIGGAKGNTNLSTMNVYDPSTDTWSTPTTTGTFTPRWSLGAAVVGGKIYVMGGVN
ncbi:MAG: kelch repeat-containing protein, partial [Candidatus Kapaibacterium sp.]